MGKKPFLDVYTLAFTLHDIKQQQNSASLLWNWGLQYCFQGWQNPWLELAECSTNTDESHEGDSLAAFAS